MHHKHQIVLSSSYSTGRRICLHFVDCDDGEFEEHKRTVEKAYDGKEVSFSIHVIHTESVEWDSVVKKDPYFGDVVVIGSIDEFVSLIQKDRYLSGLQVARYILTKGQCTHTRLQKLTYMCYADYLCKYDERLFLDEIYAFEHGPVIDTVYERYSGHGRQLPATSADEKDPMCDQCEKMPIKSRLLFAEDGWQKIESIDSTFEYYSSFTTEELIQLTHKDRTPWSVTKKTGPYTKIKDSDILQYHKNEKNL